MWIESMEDFSDGQLVKKAKGGDIEAFSELTRRYQEKIYQTIVALTQNHVDTDDLVQETFMKAFHHLKRFREKSSFYTWIYRIAINLTLNFLKKRKREGIQEDFDEAHPPKEIVENSVSSPEKDSLEKELSLKLKEAINSLPILYKTSFILVELQGMSHRKAAKVLRCSENTISWRMHKARKMLQNKLEIYLQEAIK